MFATAGQTTGPNFVAENIRNATSNACQLNKNLDFIPSAGKLRELL